MSLSRFSPSSEKCSHLSHIKYGQSGCTECCQKCAGNGVWLSPAPDLTMCRCDDCEGTGLEFVRLDNLAESKQVESAQSEQSSDNGVVIDSSDYFDYPNCASGLIISPICPPSEKTKCVFPLPT